MKKRHAAFPEVAVTESDATCPVMMGQRNAGGVMTALPGVETGLDFEDEVLATLQPSKTELMQAPVLPPVSYNVGITPVKLQADMIAWKRKTVQQTIDGHEVRKVRKRKFSARLAIA